MSYEDFRSQWNADLTYTCGNCVHGPPPSPSHVVAMTIISREFRNQRIDAAKGKS